MACSKCGQKKKVNSPNALQMPQALPVAANGVQPLQLNNQTFAFVEYLGEDGQLNSVIPGVSYGFRKKNAKLWIAKVDIDTNPTLFKE